MVHDLTEEEMQEIEVHRYYLSEKAGHDVGLECSIADWVVNHSKNWPQKRIKEEAEDQIHEIVKHKWCLSEKVGYDVGTHFAACDWIKNYARQWRDWKKEQYKKSKSCHSNQSK